MQACLNAQAGDERNFTRGSFMPHLARACLIWKVIGLAAVTDLNIFTRSAGES
jgi:hypothetical protein